jgi:hypothetical protein
MGAVFNLDSPRKHPMFLDRHYLCERMHGEKSVTKYRDIEVQY